MNKLILAAAVTAAATLNANAEGYQVNSLSAKQLGMGHTGIALELGAESMFFNPAGMAFMDNTLDLSASVAAISSHISAKTPDGTTYHSDNKISTPLMVAAAFKVYDNFKAGVSFYTPYGSSVTWGDNWPGAVLNQNVDLKIYTVQPTLSWAITDKLSIGAGAMVSWGTVDLNKALVTASTADRAIAVMKQLGQLPAETPAFGNTTPASVNLKGSADVVVGFNVGAMYKINEKINVGAQFRTRMDMKVKKGDASVIYANSVASSMLGSILDLINNANFAAQMPAPWVLGFGVSYKPIPRLTLALDARLTGWHAYKTLDIDFLADQLEPYDQHILKDYKNAWAFSLGAQYAITDRCDLRAGLMTDLTPVNKECFNPETPGMTRIAPTVGFSFRPIPSFSIDLGFMYTAGCGRKGASCEYADLLGANMIARLQAAGIPDAAIQQMGFSSTGKFAADYKLHAFTPSIGIQYKF